MATSATTAVRDDRAAIDKAISLLNAFGAQASTGLGVSELARRTSLNKSTAHRVLAMLERNGVVERIGTEYRLGAYLHDLGRAVYPPGHERIRDVLLPYLTDLYELTRQTVHLATLHGTDVVYLAKLYGHRPMPTPSRIGGRLPAHCTAVGKALLAYDTAAAARALSEPLRSFTASTIADPVDLAAELDRIRRTGIAFDDEESQPGLTCVASPVLTPDRRAVAALSIAAPRGQVDTAQLSTGLRRVAAAASQAIARAGVHRTR